MAQSTPNLTAAVEDSYGLPRGAISAWGGERAATVALYATDDEQPMQTLAYIFREDNDG